MRRTVSLPASMSTPAALYSFTVSPSPRRREPGRQARIYDDVAVRGCDEQRVARGNGDPPIAAGHDGDADRVAHAPPEIDDANLLRARSRVRRRQHEGRGNHQAAH